MIKNLRLENKILQVLKDNEVDTDKLIICYHRGYGDKLDLYTNQPGIVIGYQGKVITNLKEELQKDFPYIKEVLIHEITGLVQEHSEEEILKETERVATSDFF